MKAAIDYLASRPEVKAHSIFVVGHSLGGAVTLYACQGDKRIKGVALWATPHDHAYNVKKFITMKWGRAGYFLFLLASYIDAMVNGSHVFSFHVYGIPLKPRHVRQRLMKLKESEAVTKLENTPILIVVGSSDLIVGVEEAKIIYSAANQPKELAVIDSADHAF